MSVISAGNTTTTALVQRADTTGNLVFTTGGANTTALTIDNTQAATFAGAVTISGISTHTGNASFTNVTASGSISSVNTFGFKNRLINGAMAISQRGTTINSITVDGTYTADRWYINRGGTINYTQGTSSPPTGFNYYASYVNQTASNPFLNVVQLIESINSYDLLGKTVTFSVWLKAAANTAGSTAVTLSLGRATTADTKYTAISGTTAFTISSSAWTQCSISVAVSSTWLSISPIISLGTMAVGDGIYVTGAQLEVGSQATSFDFRSIGTETTLCQRYYQKYANMILGSWGSGNYIYQSFLYPVPMRTAPTWNYSNIGYASSSTLATNAGYSNQVRIALIITAGGGYGYCTFDMETSGAEL